MKVKKTNMKLTLKQLKQLIREQVEESKESIALRNKRVALASANRVIKLMQAIKDKLQDVFQDDNQWMEVEKHLDMAAELVVSKQNELETDPWKKAQMMDMSDL